MIIQPLADIIAITQAHQASCDRSQPCLRCDRARCRCGAVFQVVEDGASEVHSMCPACRGRIDHEQALLAFARTVPKHFRWALGATAVELAQRVQLPVERIARAVGAPPALDLILQGDTGMGKTSLAVAMLHALVQSDSRRWGGARFCASYWVAGARGRHALGKDEAPEVTEAMRAPILLLDDLGSEASDRRNVVEDIVFYRHNEDLPTWITTGWSEAQLSERYGSQVARRIVEGSKRVQLGCGR